MKLFRFLIGLTAVFILWNSCVNDNETENPDLQINLRWVKAYPTETQENVTAGLSWCLSFLGASLPDDFLVDNSKWKSETVFALDFSRAGFTKEALDAWTKLIPQLKTSEEYVDHGGIDIGRFVMLTLNSTNHYYAITGAEKKLSEFRAKYSFIKKRGAIINSFVAVGNRAIEISNAGKFQEIAFIATEGTGSILGKSFEEKEFETMSFMSNGQLRFALYDLKGNLKTSASPELTAAGKPSKCLWCHEINISSILQENPVVDGYLSDIEYNSLIAERVKLMRAYRSTLTSGVNFLLTQQHTQGELLYLSFMEPSAERLALEWGIEPDQVKSMLATITTHKNEEFAFLGEALYSRKDIDKFSPYEALEVPDEPRNKSSYEPNLIKP
jgi:hypothetical protein